MEPAAKHVKPQFSSGAKEEVFHQLRKEVNAIVRTHQSSRSVEIRFKAFFFPLLYIAIWGVAMRWGATNIGLYYLFFGLLGLMIVVVFLNIIHDAVHGTIFTQKRWNDLFVYVFDLMGANSFIWRLRHVRFHHNYPNVNGWDTDMEQTDIFRVFPNGPHSRMHRYQHLYMPLIYPLFLFNWLLIRDFRDFFNPHKTVRKLIHIPVKEYLKLFLFKGFFFFYLIGFPVLFLNIPFLQALIGFGIMLITASVFSLVVLLPPHANMQAAFPLPDEENKLPDNWFIHMLRTTNDVTGDNHFTRFFMGCFHYHVAHHLFPNVHHVFYPEITAKLKDYAKKYDLPYRQMPILQALKSHFELIRQNGRVEDFNIWEESM